MGNFVNQSDLIDDENMSPGRGGDNEIRDSLVSGPGLNLEDI